MDDLEDYLSVNRRHWDSAVAAHLKSDFYNVKGFLAGECSLNPIELDLLGDISGLRILHLQCHFGLDSLSLARRGAVVTGVDFSPEAIAAARTLSAETGIQAEFLCCALYDLPQHLNAQFDVVFTSYGTIGWLPDLNAWAAIVAHFLTPGGRFVMADFHPFIWMFDQTFSELTYDYFNTGSIVEEEEGSYADRAAQTSGRNITWNHPLSETLGSLLNKGLVIKRFEEYDYSPYPCFANLRQDGPGVFRFRTFEHQVPVVFGLLCNKSA
ncbi:MAG: class I SAM-dependent methyltransferase [Bacteroidota bacterium]